ncbi:MAG TPA: hypothetical protein VK772_04260, partial [Puia sp.]|nr:hypothetical protein [Puia sp.]
MKKIILVSAFSFLISQTNGQTATVILHLPEAKVTINKNIYGHFAEHLGRCIYDGLYIGDTNRVIP